MMGLKIAIDHSKLVDSAYDESMDSIFDFTTSDTEGFVQDIVNGHPTCYLISGYRGAGKSSFIKKLAVDVIAKEEKALFIYLNFAKHEERTILLRKLIRNFYLRFETIESSLDFSGNESLNEALIRFKDLYERTFYAVSRNTNEKKVEKTISTIKFQANFKDIAVSLISVAISFAIIAGFNTSNWYSWILGVLPYLALLKYFSVEKEKSKENSNSSEVSKDMLYDDEIAEHYLIEVISSFQGHIKPIFVLDELDKISNDDLIENLINELKPIMLSGLASFIVVAGQNLYYNYYKSQTQDDGPLSSLFSKAHHVSLFTTSELRLLFKRIIKIDLITLSPSDNQLLEGFIDYLIFKSNRIPRRFISLLRQQLIWDGNDAFLDIEKEIGELAIYSKVLQRIENIDSNEIITRGYPEPIRDYLNMQLLLESHKILSNQDLNFTIDQIKI